MAVTNSGNNVIADASTNTIANLTSATNTKVQDSTIYTITSGAIGSNANGQILLTKAGNSILNLDSRNTYAATTVSINGGGTGDTPLTNTYLSLKGAKLVVTGYSGQSETIAPIKGDAQTQIHYRGTGTTWNSKHKSTELIGSTLFFEAGGDGHLGKHADAKIENVNLIWKSTSNSEFVLGMQANWDTTNKPSGLKGLRFISVNGNSFISFFTWSLAVTPASFSNGFSVNADWIYDVAPVGTRPSEIRRSYRRSDYTTNASSYFGAVLINPTYLWIDPKTTLSASGVLDSTPTYLNNVQYRSDIGASDNCSDIIAYRFAPTIQKSNGDKISDVKIVVLNLNTNTTNLNHGVFRCRYSASGYTGSDGKFVITEPSTKDYTSASSYLTDSVVIQNRTRTQAYHKWWETGAKLIIIQDSRGTIGTTAGETYSQTADYVSLYRKSGFVFVDEVLNMTTPFSSAKTLTEDVSYNSSASTTGMTVTYNAGVTNVEFGITGNYTLDSIYKAITDFHSTQTNTELRTINPLVQNNGKLEYLNSQLTFSFGSGVIITLQKGTKITQIKNTDFLFVASIILDDIIIEGNVSQATPTNLSNVTISGTLTYNTNTATSIAISNNTSIGTVANSGTGIVTISRDNTSSITTYTDAEINFLDSNLSAVNITSATIYGSQSDRDSGINPGATFTTSLDFEYGSVVSGVTMQNTVYLRVEVGSVTLFAQITLVLGSNTLDLGVQGQLSAINAKVDQTNDNLPKVNRNVIKASKSIPAGETF